ncbi:hypothetical protein HanXRQr2_Chr05g0209611 [Helianthus annuus]|uniref:Uncharacterized protein n=1 Tax=Helianthus annuus TaxID=4232 RepID=A0A9K3NM75_HELAN|nr:hypothetical protein HanXRQr2_Chr05g0209611 [Helianthus annuus]KAJ0922343.1 hypothetical protein HanPSC8_Chr05g0202671 [Helianthus annuus]
MRLHHSQPPPVAYAHPTNHREPTTTVWPTTTPRWRRRRVRPKRETESESRERDGWMANR